MKKFTLKRLIAYSILSGFVLFPTVSNALDLTLEPRFQAGVMDYKFEQKPISITDEETGDTVKDHGFKLVDALFFVGGGATLFADRFFVDLYVQKAFSGSDRATNRYDDPALGERVNIPTFDGIVDVDFDREEYSVSIGYAVGSQWVLFTGYRVAQTNYNGTLTVNAEGATNDNRPVIIAARSEYDSDFKQDGLFVGGAYAFSISERSVISLNAALAALDGKLERDSKISNSSSVDGKPVSVEPELEKSAFDGDTVGLNLGVAWKGSIFGKLGYSFGVNGYRYNFDAKNVGIADISESVLRFSAGLSYQF